MGGGTIWWNHFLDCVAKHVIRRKWSTKRHISTFDHSHSQDFTVLIDNIWSVSSITNSAVCTYVYTINLACRSILTLCFVCLSVCLSLSSCFSVVLDLFTRVKACDDDGSHLIRDLFEYTHRPMYISLLPPRVHTCCGRLSKSLVALYVIRAGVWSVYCDRTPRMEGYVNAGARGHG